MDAKEYLNKYHPTAIRSMDEISSLVSGIDNYSQVIIQLLESYHQAKSKEEGKGKRTFTETDSNDATHVVHEYGTNKTVGVIEISTPTKEEAQERYREELVRFLAWFFDNESDYDCVDVGEYVDAYLGLEEGRNDE